MLETVSINTEHYFIKALNDLEIDEVRAHLLREIAFFIGSEIEKNKQVNLNFICTHNSRRSQLAQLWSSYATYFFNMKKIACFSGGTEVTAFYRNTVKVLQEVGFKFQILEFSHQNPKYLIHFDNCTKPVIGFSKMYDDIINKKPFIAITTCSNADKNCPYITDTIKRFHLPFTDPKKFDYTSHESKKYLETNKQIAGEIHYIFRTIENSI